MIFTRERKNNRKNRKTISFVMFSGGKKMGPLARNGLDTITVQSGKMGKEYTELKKRVRKKHCKIRKKGKKKQKTKKKKKKKKRPPI